MGDINWKGLAKEAAGELVKCQAEVKRLKGEPPMTWDAEKQLMRSECTALKAEVETWNSIYDESHAEVIKQDDQIVVLKAEIEAAKIRALEYGEHARESQKVARGYALALKDAREVLSRVIKVARGYELRSPEKKSYFMHEREGIIYAAFLGFCDSAIEALSRTADPTALLLAHDREREAKVWDEAWFKFGDLITDQFVYGPSNETADALNRLAGIVRSRTAALRFKGKS